MDRYQAHRDLIDTIRGVEKVIREVEQIINWQGLHTIDDKLVAGDIRHEMQHLKNVLMAFVCEHRPEDYRECAFDEARRAVNRLLAAVKRSRGACKMEEGIMERCDEAMRIACEAIEREEA